MGSRHKKKKKKNKEYTDLYSRENTVGFQAAGFHSAFDHNRTELSTSKAIPLFIRNKFVEISALLIKVLYVLVLLAIALTVIVYVFAGIGYLLHMLPFFKLATPPAHFAEYGVFVIPLVLFGGLAFMLIYGLILGTRSLIEWIQDNWSLAKRGKRVKFLS